MSVSRLSTICALMLMALSAMLVPGCDEKASADRATVTIKGKKFQLEIVADDDKRMLGLGKREAPVDDDGGMIFVFTDAVPRGFVMRDCKFPIDIIYLDGSGRILSKYAMTPEPPRDATEKEDDEAGNAKYNARLKQYHSRFPTQIVIELKGGMIDHLKLTDSDKIVFDAEGLKKLAR